MAVEYDKHGDPIYRPSVSQVIAERLLDYVAKVNADPEATFHPEDSQIIIEDAKIIGERLFAKTKEDFEFRLLMKKCVASIEKQRQAPAQTKKPRRKHDAEI